MEAGNETAAAETEGFADELAIDIDRSFANVEEPLPKLITNVKTYLDPLHTFQHCIITSINCLSNRSNFGINTTE